MVKIVDAPLLPSGIDMLHALPMEPVALEVGTGTESALAEAVQLARGLNEVAHAAVSDSFGARTGFGNNKPQKTLEIQYSLLKTLEQDPNPTAFSLMVSGSGRNVILNDRDLQKAVRVANGETCGDISAEEYVPLRIGMAILRDVVQKEDPRIINREERAIQHNSRKQSLFKDKTLGKNPIYDSPYTQDNPNNTTLGSFPHKY